MHTYTYHALKKSGHPCKGTIEADSERHARTLLRQQGLVPTMVQAAKTSTRRWRQPSLSTQEVALLTRQLATLLSAGIPIDEALRGVAAQSEQETTQHILLGVRTKVMEGYTIAQALGEYPRVFPELYRATIHAGEQTSHLDRVLEKLADYTEAQQKTKQKIQQALIYPSLMMFISCAMISFLLAFVVPKIIDVFRSSGQTLPIMTRVLIQLSEWIQADGLYLLLALVLGALVFQRSLTYPSVKRRVHLLQLKMPLVGHMVQSVNIARYIHTFSILFSSGASILETMRVSASLVNQVIIREALDQATLRVKEGIAISIALQETRFFSPMATHLIASGEKSGQLATMMERAALHLDHEVQRRIDTGLTLLEPFIILFMGTLVLFIVLSTLLPIFSMEQLV